MAVLPSITDLQAQITLLNGQIVSLKATNTDLQAQNDALKKENAALKADKTQLTSDNSSLKTLLASYGAEITAMELRCQRMQDATDAARKRAIAIRQEAATGLPHRV